MLLLLGTILPTAQAQTYEAIAGYAPGSNVTEHNALDGDQAAMQTALSAANFSGANHSYSVGGHSASKGSYRTLQGFSTGAQAKMYDGCPGCPYRHYEMFYDYYGDFDYADKWVSAALGGTDMSFTSGKFGPNAFSGMHVDARVEAVQKGSAYMHVWMYAVREFEDAIDDCISVPSLGLPSFPAAPSTCIPASTTLALKWNSYASEWGAYEITGCAGVNPKLTLAAGTTYTFDQSDASNWCATRPHVSELLALHCLCLACSQPAVSAQPSARAAVQVPPDRLRLHRGRRAHVVQAGRGRHSG